MALIQNPKFNPALPESAANQRFIFSDPNTVINPITGQTAASAASLGTITSESLTPAQEPKLPTYKPVDLTSATEGALAGANYQPATYTTPSGAVVDAMGNIVTPAPEKPAETPASQEKSLIDRMKSLMGITGDEGLVPTPPKSAAEAYKEAYETEELKTKRAAISSLNKELADLNAQYQTLKLAEQTIPMQMQEWAEGRGVTKAGLAPLTAGELRKNALAMFPVTSRILSVSAQLSAAQGDYDNATNYLDKLLTLQQQDRENEYNYRKDLFNFAYQIADKEETRALQKAQEAEEAEKEKKDDFAALKKDYIAKATAENDFATATKMALAEDENQLANLLSQIQIAPEKPTTGTQTEKDLATYYNVVQQLEASKGKDGYVDTRLYGQLKAQYPQVFKWLSAEEWLNPKDEMAKKYFQTSAQAIKEEEIKEEEKDPFEAIKNKALQGE